jgi:AcrR family transcriptional regulator
MPLIRQRYRVGRPKQKEQPSTVQEDAKKKLISTAARELFFERGYDTTSMDEVARHAGVSKATVYAHFESKENLLLQLIHDEVEAMPIVPQDGPVRTMEELRAALRSYAEQFALMFQNQQTVALHRLVIAQAHMFEGIGKAFYEAVPQAMEREVSRVLRAGVDSGILQIADLDVAASQFLSLVVGILPLRAVLSSKPPSMEVWTKTVESGLAIFLAAYACHARKA